MFSFCSARRERGTTPARPQPPCAARGHELSAERQRRAVEVARLVSARTAIRPSYTSAAIRAAPSPPRRPFSLLLSPRSRAHPSLHSLPALRSPPRVHSARGARRRASRRRRRRRRRRAVVSMTVRRDADLSRVRISRVDDARLYYSALLLVIIRATASDENGGRRDVPISRDRGERRQGH